MSLPNRAMLAAILVAGPSLVIWFHVPVATAALGCAMAAGASFVRRRFLG